MERNHILDDAQVSVFRSYNKRQMAGIPDGTFLEPRLWEALRRRLQEEYRLATGEQDAVLIIQEPCHDER